MSTFPSLFISVIGRMICALVEKVTIDSQLPVLMVSTNNEAKTLEKEWSLLER